VSVSVGFPNKFVLPFEQTGSLFKLKTINYFRRRSINPIAESNLRIEPITSQEVAREIIEKALPFINARTKNETKMEDITVMLPIDVREYIRLCTKNEVNGPKSDDYGVSRVETKTIILNPMRMAMDAGGSEKANKASFILTLLHELIHVCGAGFDKARIEVDSRKYELNNMSILHEGYTEIFAKFMMQILFQEDFKNNGDVSYNLYSDIVDKLLGIVSPHLFQDAFFEADKTKNSKIIFDDLTKIEPELAKKIFQSLYNLAEKIDNIQNEQDEQVQITIRELYAMLKSLEKIKKIAGDEDSMEFSKYPQQNFSITLSYGIMTETSKISEDWIEKGSLQTAFILANKKKCQPQQSEVNKYFVEMIERFGSNMENVMGVLQKETGRIVWEELQNMTEEYGLEKFRKLENTWLKLNKREVVAARLLDDYYVYKLASVGEVFRDMTDYFWKSVLDNVLLYLYVKKRQMPDSKQVIETLTELMGDIERKGMIANAESLSIYSADKLHRLYFTPKKQENIESNADKDGTLEEPYSITSDIQLVELFQKEFPTASLTDIYELCDAIQWKLSIDGQGEVTNKDIISKTDAAAARLIREGIESTPANICENIEEEAYLQIKGTDIEQVHNSYEINQSGIVQYMQTNQMPMDDETVLLLKICAERVDVAYPTDFVGISPEMGIVRENRLGTVMYPSDISPLNIVDMKIFRE